MLLEMSLKNFINLLSSDAPAPGGGSVSALSGLLGASLTTMVCRLSIGRKVLDQNKDELIDVLEKADKILADLTALVDRDTEAFNQVMAAFHMPKTTSEEKIVRNIAIQNAYRIATEVPLEVAAACCSVLELIASICDKFNLNTASDLGVGAKCSYLGLTGALLNVRINIPAIKDQEYVSAIQNKIEVFQSRAKVLNSKIDTVIQNVIFSNN